MSNPRRNGTNQKKSSETTSENPPLARGDSLTPISKLGSMSENDQAVPEVPRQSPTERRGPDKRAEEDGPTPAPNPGDDQEPPGRSGGGTAKEATGLAKEKEEIGWAGKEEEPANENEGRNEEAGGGREGAEGAEQTTTERREQEEPVEEQEATPEEAAEATPGKEEMTYETKLEETTGTSKAETG